MAIKAQRFTDMQIKALPVGRHADGEGLYIYVTARARSWVMRYTLGGKRHELGLGGYPKVSLGAARKQAADIRTTLEQGGNPKAEREKRKAAIKRSIDRTAPDALSMRRLDNVIARTFEAEKRGLKGGGAAGRWLSPLNTHIIPKLGARDVEGITPQDVASTLRHIWHEKTDVSRKAMQRLGKALALARAEGLEVRRDITADARDILGKQHHVATHIPSMDWRDVPEYYANLGDSAVDLCLRLLILTGLRSKPVRFAHVDHLKGDVWTVPAPLMKGSEMQGRDESNNFSVPLAPEAVAIIDAARLQAVNGYLFTGPQGKPISDMAMSIKMRRDNLDARPHGFRRSFRTWADDVPTMAAFEAKEKSLAHKVGSKVTQTYAQAEMLEERRALLDQWAAHVCRREVAEITELSVWRAK